MFRRVSAVLALAVVATLAHAAPADDISAQKVNIVARKNPGDVPYRAFINSQQKLDSYLAPEPRLVEWYYRLSFTEMPLGEQGNYEPRSWGVSIVGDTVDETVPVSRGGYFLLPVNKTAYKENATIMFHEQTNKLFLSMVWALHVGSGQRISYVDLGKALEELKGVQSRIPSSDRSLRAPKHAEANGLWACFRDPSGRIHVTSKNLALTREGNCYGIKYDPARAAAGDEIEFIGQLELVTFASAKGLPNPG